jgi:SAM-dependent methyltransferase
VALAAPRVFNSFYELPMALVLCAVLAIVVSKGSWKVGLWWSGLGTAAVMLHREFDRTTALYPLAGWAVAAALMLLARWRLKALWTALAVVMAVYLGYELRVVEESPVVQVRNFYGGLKVNDDTSENYGPERKLLHGAINHGLQLTTAEFRRTPTTYYTPTSGAGLAILNTRHEGQRVGVIGLGTGTLAAYSRSGDYFRFYEINPQVLELARRQFTYLADSPAKLDVALGDARLVLDREPSQQFDVLAVDAFSGDSIPVHLLTRESFALYFRHLRPGGVLAVHVSNRYLDLEPVVRQLADSLHKRSALFETEDGDLEMFESSWVLVSDNAAFWELPDVKKAAQKIELKRGLKAWTDDFSNLFQIVRWRG